ncbi:hypothetical protein KKE06_01655 [Candidatus Micrarchaeota archaeon]|nr:hypothetical protein [Candidatus Micrarchaeota archaeon]MBU1930552.1 hypothetical protein [Candidatus Micrarchaeota archaeon]
MPRIKWTPVEQTRTQNAHRMKKVSQTTIDKILEASQERFKKELKQSPHNRAFWEHYLYSTARYRLIAALKKLYIQDATIRKDLLVAAKTLATKSAARIQAKKTSKLQGDTEAIAAWLTFRTTIETRLGKRAKRFLALLDEMHTQTLP